ncbi:MAG: response regulator, partial [Planctomycetota bacterium]
MPSTPRCGRRCGSGRASRASASRAIRPPPRCGSPSRPPRTERKPRVSSAPSILVVADAAAIRRGSVDALTYSKYEVVECGDGEAGLERALGGGFDLLLLDVMLPGIDGFEVLRALRRERSPLPVILITARGAEDDRG